MWLEFDSMYEVVASVFRVEELHGSDSPQGSSLCVCVCVLGGAATVSFFFPLPSCSFYK